MRAFISLIGGAVAVAIAVLMALMGAGHTFSASGGVVYYGIVFALGVGGVFVIPVAWSYLSNDK